MSELKPRITENGIDYILVGDYYIPDLKLPEEHRPIGKYGRMPQRSPVDYLNMYRIDSACRMLRVSGCSVTEAGFSCGFNDLSYFVKTFKKYKGVTPKQYRKRYESETGAVVGKRIF